MTKIIIQNIGPISNVELEINKINIIMGPQSSGKSTIAKIFSYCQWVEKRYLLDGEYTYKVSEQLIKFHRLDESYFSDDSFIEYESYYVKITYKGKNLEQSIESKNNIIEYQKSKNIYIPSERNFVSAIPNLNKYNETNDNVMNFVYDWYSAKSKFSKNNLLSVLNFEIDFYNNEKNDSDMLILHKDRKEIPLRSGSSGLQSVVPLILIVEYLTNSIYTEKYSPSVDESKSLLDLLRKNGLIDLENNILKEDNDSLKLIASLRDKRTKYHSTNFIIEEPEQNLFPETQRDLIYFIFNKINLGENYSLLLTTHSPYILYAINNCLMGDVISSKLSNEEKKEFLSKNSWISPDKVNILEINKKDGTIHSIKNPKTGTVDKHYFNKTMNDIMDEYYTMLSFFSNEE
jgi:predicted ATPase